MSTNPLETASAARALRTQNRTIVYYEDGTIENKSRSQTMYFMAEISW